MPDSKCMWELFAKTGLPEAYNLCKDLEKDEKRQPEQQIPSLENGGTLS